MTVFSGGAARKTCDSSVGATQPGLHCFNQTMYIVYGRENLNAGMARQGPILEILINERFDHRCYIVSCNRVKSEGLQYLWCTVKLAKLDIHQNDFLSSSSL